MLCGTDPVLARAAVVVGHDRHSPILRALSVPRMTDARASGRCLCGAVRYEVRGPMRDILLCHCEECRRWSGYIGAFSATRAQDLALLESRTLRWIDSPASDRNARRAFCEECGSSLFWQAADGERISIAAGTLDRPTGLLIVAHIYTHQAFDYDVLSDDGLPRDAGAIEIRWS